MDTVIFGTDGISDYVEVGKRRYSLGPVSIVTLISGLVSDVRGAMNAFLADGRVQVRVNLEEMWELLPVRKARFSSIANHMSVKGKTGSAAPTHEDLVASILNRISAADLEIEALEGSGFPVTKPRLELIRIASALEELVESDLDTTQAIQQLYRDVGRVL